MATSTGTRAGSTFPVTQPYSGSLAVAWGNVSIAAAPSVGDYFEVCKVPAGAVVVDVVLRASDMDTGGPTLTFDVGYSGDDDAYGAALAAGSAGAVHRIPAASAAWPGYAGEAAERTVRLRCAATATTFAAGTASVHVLFTMA